MSAGSIGDLTVAIPTFEGDPSLLRRVLGAARRQAPGDVLAVDMSRSSVVADACADVGGITHVPFVHSRGIAQSRNECLRLSPTRFVLLLDSDAVPDEGWAIAMRAAFAHDDVAVVGARVLPDWQREPPTLFSTATAADWLSMFDLGPRSTEVPRVMGTSYAVDLERVGRSPFDESLGRKPDDGMGHEEVRLALDVRRAGWRCWYAADAVVRHVIGPERATWRFMLRRAFAAGRELTLERERLDPLPRRLTARDHAFRAVVAPAVLAGRVRGA